MFIDSLKPFLDWLHIHPYWAGFFVFLISFGESIAVFGLLVPGSVVMTAIGALMGAGVLPMYPMLAWAIAGAVIGDVFSFWLGCHFHQNVRNLWPFTRYPQVLLKGEEFFERHGGKSVFLGRFVGPIRPVIPLVAGMLRMKPIRFFMADIPAAIGWAPAYMLPGILLGELSLKLQPEIATRFLLVIFALLILLWLIYWLLKQVILGTITTIRYFLTYLWLRFSPVMRWMVFMEVPGDKKDAKQFRVFSFFLLLVGIFCLMTYSVLHHGIFLRLNDPIFHFMRSLQNPIADYVMNSITFLGIKEVAFAISIMVAICLIAKRRFWALSHFLVVTLLCVAGTHLIKNWVQSPRPGLLFFTQYGWSFPSGHTVLAATVFGFLAVLITEKSSLFVRRCCYSFVAAIVVAVAVSRVYLGFHWFSDVIGGMIFGLLLVVGATFSYRRRQSTPIEPMPFGIIVLLSGLLAWGIYTFYYFSHPPKVVGVPYLSVQVLNEKVWWTELGYKPPFYRTNRFGKPVQLINIQWAGDLSAIQQALFKANWKIAAKPDLALIVAHFTNENKLHLNPLLFTKYYHNQKPVLVMTKVVNDQRVIIIRLWDSHMVLYKSGYPVWVGTVGYYRPWHPLFLKQGMNNEAPKISAINEFKKDLGPFRWKEIFYSSEMQPKVGENADWTGNVLLIRPSEGV